MPKIDFAVFIGRFQPLHLGHQHVIDEALKVAERVIVLIGSADNARTPDRNPFTFEERWRMFGQVYAKQMKAGTVILRPISDFPYNDDAWIAQVQNTVDQIVLRGLNGPNVARNMLHGTRDAKVSLVGYAKDHTSYYLKLFPDWGQIDVKSLVGIDATNIRKDFFDFPSRIVPPLDLRVQSWLQDWKQIHVDVYDWLFAESCSIEEYKDAWSRSPFPPTFNTIDAVVVQSGHVLLIERGDHPGKGLWAIPGGFVNQWERLRAGAVRELKEETRISDDKGEIPPAMLDSFILGPPQVFDAPHRSSRGRVITTAFKFVCPDRRTLFKVRGDDDAAHARWRKLADVKANPSRFFDDHYAMLQQMIGI